MANRKNTRASETGRRWKSISKEITTVVKQINFFRQEVKQTTRGTKERDTLEHELHDLKQCLKNLHTVNIYYKKRYRKYNTPTTKKIKE